VSAARDRALAELGRRVLEAIQGSFDDATSWEMILIQKKRGGVKAYAPESSDVFEEAVRVAFEQGLLVEPERLA
jgi:hypothetical protein